MLAAGLCHLWCAASLRCLLWPGSLPPTGQNVATAAEMLDTVGCRVVWPAVPPLAFPVPSGGHRTVVRMRRSRRETRRQKPVGRDGSVPGAPTYDGDDGVCEAAVSQRPGGRSGLPVVVPTSSKERDAGGVLSDVDTSSPVGSVTSLDSDDGAEEFASSNDEGDTPLSEDLSDDDHWRYILPEDDLAASGDDDSGVVPPSGTGVDASGADCRLLPALSGFKSIFHSAEELYGYLLLRGVRQLSEDQYQIVRAGFNISSPLPLPSLTRVREGLAPRVSS